MLQIPVEMGKNDERIAAQPNKDCSFDIANARRQSKQNISQMDISVRLGK